MRALPDRRWGSSRTVALVIAAAGAPIAPSTAHALGGAAGRVPPDSLATPGGGVAVRLAVASLVVSVLAVTVCSIPLVGLPMAGIGLALGLGNLKASSWQEAQRRRLAVAAAVVGLLALVIQVGLVGVLFAGYFD